MNIDNRYMEHIASIEISGLCFSVLMLLITEKRTQSDISKITTKSKQVINKQFIELERVGLIECVEVKGSNKFYRAITDFKKLKINIPGQLKMI